LIHKFFLKLRKIWASQKHLIRSLVTDEHPSKCPRLIQPEEMDATIFQHDPGLRPQIWEFPVNLQDEM